MDVPKIKTRVVHSESKSAWNVVGIGHGDKYKIARVPYNDITQINNVNIATNNKRLAYEHAVFISTCFNNVSKGEYRIPKNLKVPSIDEELVLEEGLDPIFTEGEAF